MSDIDRGEQMADIAEIAGAEFFGDDFEVEGGPEPSTAVIDSNDRARDEQGRFTSLTKEPETDASVSESEETADEETGETEDSAEADVPPEAEDPGSAEPDEEVVIDDEAVLAYLEKYDGDVVAALKAATEAQSLIGTQGQELGKFRDQFEQALDERLQAMQAQIISQTINWDEQIEDNPRRAADLALQVGNGDALVTALQAWAEEDGDESGPMLFLRAAQAELALQEAQGPPAPPEPEPDFAGVMEAFKAKHPDVQQHLPAIQQIVGERPTLARALSEGSPQERALALEDALLLARSQRQGADTSAAARRVILRAKHEADAAKADAVVESASRTSAAQAGPSEDEVLQSDLRTLTGLDDLVVV